MIYGITSHSLGRRVDALTLMEGPGDEVVDDDKNNKENNAAS